MSNDYRLIPIDMPPWKLFAAQLDLIVRDDERKDFIGLPYMVYLPDVLHGDYVRFAKQIGWTPGQVIGFLAMQGALRLAELDVPLRADRQEGKL